MRTTEQLSYCLKSSFPLLLYHCCVNQFPLCGAGGMGKSKQACEVPLLPVLQAEALKEVTALGKAFVKGHFEGKTTCVILNLSSTGEQDVTDVVTL